MKSATADRQPGWLFYSAYIYTTVCKEIKTKYRTISWFDVTLCRSSLLMLSWFKDELPFQRTQRRTRVPGNSRAILIVNATSLPLLLSLSSQLKLFLLLLILLLLRWQTVVGVEFSRFLRSIAASYRRRDNHLGFNSSLMIGVYDWSSEITLKHNTELVWRSDALTTYSFPSPHIRPPQ